MDQVIFDADAVAGILADYCRANWADKRTRHVRIATTTVTGELVAVVTVVKEEVAQQ